MNSNYTILIHVTENWKMSKKKLIELGINPDKPFGEITYNEMATIAEELDILVTEFIE